MRSRQDQRHLFKDKQGGLMVDYIGIGNELKAAMKEYTCGKGRGCPTVDAREALSVLAEKLDVLQTMVKRILRKYKYPLTCRTQRCCSRRKRWERLGTAWMA